MNFLFPAVTLFLALAGPSAAAEVGVRDIAVPSTQRGGDLAVTIWYPTEAEGKTVLVGDNGLFDGAPAIADAPFGQGRFPLILLSHGSGSRVQAMSWLATALAKAGFVVAGPNHPGTTSGDSLPAETVKQWLRTQDLSTIIDALEADAQWSAVIDKDRIGVLGFSVGGATAMELSGARADLEAYARYCDANSTGDCAWYARGVAYVGGKRTEVEKLDLRKIDRQLFEQSNLDGRIKSAVLVDPGLAPAYTLQSLQAIAIPMQFINLGGAGTIAEGIIADGLAKTVQNGSYTLIDGADHFSFLPVCKPGGQALLTEEREVDPICTDAGRPRGEIHDQITGLVTDVFERTLKAK